MRTSGAAIVKEYLEKYVFINLYKTKKQKNPDQPLARIALSIAYTIIHEMDFLILSNNANDFEHIKEFLKQQVALLHLELRHRQTFLHSLFQKTTLPSDFGKCIYEAWFRLLYFEKQLKHRNAQTTEAIKLKFSKHRSG